MSLSCTSRRKRGWTSGGSSWFSAHLGSVILHFLLLAQVWRTSQQHATVHMAWVLACWFLGVLLGSWRSSRDGNWRAGCTLLATGVLLLAWTVWPKGAVLAFLVPGLWLMGAAMILAMIMGVASTRWLGSAHSVGEGTRQMGEALHAIFALVLVWSLPPSLMGTLGVGLLILLLIRDGMQRKKNALLSPRPSLPLSQWRRDWWVVYLAGRRQLGVLLLAAGVSLLLDVMIGTILTPVGAETAHDHTLGLLWYGIEGQLVAVLLGAYLVSAHREVLGPDKPLIPEEPGPPVRFLLGSALVMIAGSILAFSDHRLFTAWALPFILGGFTLGTLMWSHLLPRLCPPLSADLQHLPSRSEAAPDVWVTIDAQARTRVVRITGLLKVVCVPAVGWSIEQWGLSTIFLVTGGTLIGLVLLAAGGWAVAGRRKPEELREDVFKKKKRRGLMQSQPDTANAADDQSRGSRWSSLLWFVAILATGALLWWSGGGVPPLAWRQVIHLLSEHATSRPQFPLILGQLATLLAAWGVLLLLTVRFIARVFQPRPAPPSQHSPIEQNLQAQQVRPETIDAEESPSGHTRPKTVSASRPPQATRAGGQSPAREDRAQDSSRLLQEEDFPHSLPVWPLSSALFGEALQVTVASCSDEGTLQVPTTKAYLLTEISDKNDAVHPLPMSMIALVDHIPADEPGYTTSCRIIESIRDMVIQACMDMHHVSEEALAALFAEQVQKVIRVIGQQSQGDETLLTMAAVLIIGSTMFVEKMGDTRVYLCHAKEGFSQFTQALPVVRPRKTGTSTTSGSQVQQSRGKKREHGRRTPLAVEHGRKAVSLLAGDRILLCSDGVWSVLHASYLEHILRFSGPDPSDMCAALLQATRKSGSTEPVSIMGVQCQQSLDLLP